MRLRSFLFPLAAMTVLACASNTVTTDNDSSGQAPGNSAGAQPSTSTQQGDWAAIEKLEGEAKALASTSGCATAAECRTAPVGSRACGGPRYYIPYCAKSTDSAALFRKLDEVAAAERAYNTKYQLVSTCEFRMAPGVTLTAGACAAM